jgi:predicted transcriptional regulator
MGFDRLSQGLRLQHNARMSDVITIRVDRKTRARLERLAMKANCTASHLVEEAVRSLVDEDEGQLDAARAGGFVPEHEAMVFLRQWRQRVA